MPCHKRSVGTRLSRTLDSWDGVAVAVGVHLVPHLIGNRLQQRGMVRLRWRLIEPHASPSYVFVVADVVVILRGVPTVSRRPTISQ
mmetsp:Transcript_41059/g.108744  ORF Transcript_41059/g.108744 Transcript_41059/m.108744 type:complete len:86 (+) Transcript_41059:372-629(+)